MNEWIKRVVRVLKVGLATAAVALGAACGSDGGGSEPVAPPAAIAPAISAAPNAVALSAGQPATFSVSATGTAPFTYQWQRDGINIAGATAETYTITAPTAADNGATFRVVITNGVGSVTSAAVTLTVNPVAAVPVISSQPVGVTLTAGNTASFSVEATSSAAMTYQWQRDGANIPGATSATFALPATAATDSGATFRVIVSNSGGSVTSTSALLTVAASVTAPTITAQPQSANTVDGSTLTLSVAASGTAPFSYQWRKNGSNITGATAATYTTPALTPADTGTAYSVVVTNGGGSLISANATVTVTYLPINIAGQPAAVSVAQGQAATFTATATGSAPISYQWRKNGTAIAGATAASYTTPVTIAADDGALFTAVVTNPAGSVTTSAAKLTVNVVAVAPSIATAPASVTVGEGQAATFTTTAAGTAPFTYQWRRNGVDIASATAASYTTPATVIADNAARFSVRVTNAAGSVTSAEAALTVQAATSGLIGRAWSAGQLLETDDNVVRDRASAIDDAGRVMVVFRKSNGTRDVVYATRGTPNGTGQAPTWSTPVAIDLLGGAPVSTMGTVDYDLLMTPNGNALAYWYHTTLCSATTYNTSGNCRYYYFARFNASSGTWSAPELIGDAPSPAFRVITNDRGDISLIGTGWIRSGTSGYTGARMIYLRNPGETTFRKQLLNDQAIGTNILSMDGAGNLLLAAQYNQNATTDIVAYRGSVAVGLGPLEVLDVRGSAATLKLSTVGLNGQQAILWSQNNGSTTTTYAATAKSSTDAFVVVDLGFQIDSSLTLFTLNAGDDGVIRYYEVGFFSRKRAEWTSSAGWSTPVPMPSELYSADTWVTRGGDILAVKSFGIWASYDGKRNVMVQSFGTTPNYVLGFSKSFGRSGPLLSTNGFGYIDIFDKFDTLPTPTVPAGDGRNVTNLWGVFLK